MKRFFFGMVAVIVLLVGFGSTVQATNNFTISKYTVDMELGRDSEQRSTLRTKLTITANFPPRQNHGIAPVFVKKYNGHPTHFTLESVTDERGAPLEYTWHNDELRIGNKDTYVKGKKTYVITYTQRDVTKSYHDTGKQEFYWDAIGTNWQVPIQSASVTLKLSPELVAAKRTNLQCYQGRFGSNQRCEVREQGDTLTATARALPKRAGVTIAVGFAPGTFAAYQMSFMEQLIDWWAKLQLVLLAVALILAGVTIVAYYRSIGRRKELEPIPPEYLPPRGTSVTTSAKLVQPFHMVKGSVMAAQMIDLAVRHYIQVIEVKPRTTWRTAEYEVKVIQAPGKLLAEEQEMLRNIFGSSPKVGKRLNLKTLRNNARYAARVRYSAKQMKGRLTDDYGLQAREPQHTRRFRRYAIIISIFAVLLLSPVLLVLAGMVFYLSFGKVLTDKGLALRRHLAGLKRYIGVAEVERLQMLQSPEGAEKVKVNASDEKQLVKLYERVLPYAVLFGQEKEWSKQLGKYYEQAGEQPDWYAGQGAFNAAVFSAGMSNLSSTAVSVSSFESSTGGSTGGGFVGGGGGGGGGGGW
ncbi:DUF2207 domain-containing protein [Candidatus Saccharibacteria bacterium oral taxon 488]|nr:DUF2207 domain-containing protein [Candidatus Saccharibacteria bacterium oral taxon 488]